MSDMMKAVVTTGAGEYDKLDYREVPVPTPGPGEVLIKVLAAGINNTEINTRLGWYSSSVTASTDAMAGSDSDDAIDDGGWNAQTPFPFIQGTDCCGIVVEAGPDADAGMLDRRVLVRSCMRKHGFDRWDNHWMGSDFDGAFAQFVKVPASEVFAVDCDWTDAELGSLPCAYGTSENMLIRAGLCRGETVLITGASGGVGSATVQLAKRRGATVVAVAHASKHAKLKAIGADHLFDRDADLLAELGAESVDLVVDNVAGEHFPVMLKLLKRGGRLVSSGAIAGPVVTLDMRELYLKDVRLIGTTAWAEQVIPNLVRYIERNEIRPLVAKTFALSDIVAAQQEFLTKQHVGKFVLLPWQD
ncbi:MULTISPECIES: alcohol dehydrogenase family protein [Halomonadaceae]|uniref:alcohol dehydrogenase family protein n=1 Tax=Halomonadaceae TaxID=28256 RepID=UPI001C2DFB2D|nr:MULTISPECIES: alcohol dehydrogenase family protein [Halomonas]MDI4638448.1 alcohol dehydrogenase family protein [Halomonas sp. BMC7]